MAENEEFALQKFQKALIELKKSELYTDVELREMIDMIKLNENKMISANPPLQSFVSCIEYDKKSLQELIKRKSERRLPNGNHFLNWIFIKRVINGNRRALKHFRTHSGLNYAYFDFLKKFPEYRDVADGHVNDMLQAMSFKPKIFDIAAEWYKSTNRPDNALRIQHLCLSKHPQYTKTYLDLIQNELDNPKQTGIQERLKTYIDVFVKNDISYRLLIEIIAVVQKYNNMEEVEDYAVKKLIKKHENLEDVWHHLALRELQGERQHFDEKTKVTIGQIKSAILKYRQGIEIVSTEKRPLLWNMYLQTLVDIVRNYQASKTEQAEVIDFLRDALDRAEVEKIDLLEDSYWGWMLCSETPDEMLQKLKEGTSKYRQSVRMWVTYIRNLITQNKHELANEVLNNALSILPSSNAPEIWQAFLDSHLSCTNEIECIFEKGLNQPNSLVVVSLKPRYLQWTLLAKGLKATRELYLNLAKNPPLSNKLHHEMYRIERETMDINGCPKTSSTEFQTTLFDLWMKQFGMEDPFVYLRRSESVVQRRGPNVTQHLSDVYRQALKNLPSDKLEFFKEQMNKIESELKVRIK